MIARTARFHGYGSLRRVYQHGSTVRGAMITLKYLQRTNGPNSRTAVVVSRKVHKSAVVRNRIRRRIYEHIRQIPEQPHNTDLVFTVFSDAVATMDAAALHDTIEKLVKNIKN